MRNKKSALYIAVGSALTAVIHSMPASAEGELFSMQKLDQGYMVAYADRVDPDKYGGGKPPGHSSAKAAEGQCGMSLMDTNKDGKVTKQEFLKHHEMIFDQIDANKDGAVDQPEADGYASRVSPTSQPAPQGGTKK